MAEKEPVRSEVKQLREKLAPLANIDWEAAATNPDFGKLNFVPVIPTLRFGGQLIQALAKLDLNFLPLPLINNITRCLDLYTQAFNQIKNFEPTSANSAQSRDSHMQAIQERYTELFSAVAPVMGVWSSIVVDPDAIARDLTARLTPTVAGSVKQYEEALLEIQAARGEAKSTLDAVKGIAAQAGVTEHATVFASQASEHQDAAKNWFWMTLAALAAMIGWGFVALSLLKIPDNAGSGQIAQEIFTRIIVFTGLSYGLIWCARNYSANRHNYILNKHRQNSLTTFEAFVKAAQDSDTKNAVLIQATTSIFAAQTTGYGGKDTEVEQPSKILEVFRSAKGA